mgnify:CR=1 FL=1
MPDERRYEPRPSRCMLAAKPVKATEHVDDTALPRAVERARLMAMTARERAELALELGRRRSNA